MNDNLKKIILIVIIVVFIILSGIGISSLVYKNKINNYNKKNNLENDFIINKNGVKLQLIDESNKNNNFSVKIKDNIIEFIYNKVDMGYSVKINNKKYDLGVWVSSIGYFKNLILIETGLTSGGSSWLEIFDINGNKEFEINQVKNANYFGFSDNLIYNGYDIDENNIYLYGILQSEEVTALNILGKSIYEMTCDDVEYYKNKIIAEKTYILDYKNNYKIKEEDVTYLSDSKLYKQFIEFCKNY